MPIHHRPDRMFSPILPALPRSVRVGRQEQIIETVIVTRRLRNIVDVMSDRLGNLEPSLDIHLRSRAFTGRDGKVSKGGLSSRSYAKAR